MRTRQRVSCDESSPRSLKIAISGKGKPALYILAGWTRIVTRRQMIDPDGMLAPDGADAFAGSVLKDACEILGYKAHGGISSLRNTQLSRRPLRAFQ